MFALRDIANNADKARDRLFRAVYRRNTNFNIGAAPVSVERVPLNMTGLVGARNLGKDAI